MLACFFRFNQPKHLFVSADVYDRHVTFRWIERYTDLDQHIIQFDNGFSAVGKYYTAIQIARNFVYGF